jgi:hypothetical protein
MNKTLPYQKHSETSKRAARENTTAPTVKELILKELRERKTIGITASEMHEIMYEDRGKNVAGRLLDLENEGRVVRLECTRKTASGRDANIYVLPEFVYDRNTLEPKRKIRDKNFKRFKSYVDDIEIVHNNRRSKYNFTDDFIESLKWAVKELEG